MNDQRIGRFSPSRRLSRRSVPDRMTALSRSVAATPGSGTTSGLTTKRFGSTSRQPPNPRRSFEASRPRSATDALGRRMPIELIQSTRFLRARMRMMWVLLVGSPPQSCAKQMIEEPSSMRASREGHRHFAVDEDALPLLEVDQQPESFRVVGGARAVILGAV